MTTKSNMGLICGGKQFLKY